MTSIIYIDECGYTGEDLFNQDQPVFCLASTSLSESLCAELLHANMGNIKSAELKHTALARKPRTQTQVVDLLKALTVYSDNIRFSIAHKQYTLLTKIVDLLIEPLAYDDGVEFYKDGFNIAYSNVFYILAKYIVGEQFFLKMLRNFQRLMRERTLRAYREFFQLFFEVGLPKDFVEHTIFLRAVHSRYGTGILTEIPKDSLDIAVNMAFNLVALWSANTKDNLKIIHDRSSAIAKNKRIWDHIVSPEIPARTVGMDRRLMHFPLRVISTELGESRTYSGLQLVDILAGAMTRRAKWEINGRDPNDVYSAMLAEFLPDAFPGISMIWPSSSVTPEELGTVGPCAEDAIEHFVQQIKKLG